jgi:hypothetical protein
MTLWKLAVELELEAVKAVLLPETLVELERQPAVRLQCTLALPRLRPGPPRIGLLLL